MLKLCCYFKFLSFASYSIVDCVRVFCEHLHYAWSGATRLFRPILVVTGLPLAIKILGSILDRSGGLGSMLTCTALADLVLLECLAIICSTVVFCVARALILFEE